MIKLADTVLTTYMASKPALPERYDKWNTYFIAAMNVIWKERNTRCFTRNRTPMEIMVTRITQNAELFLKYC
jgi:hypothetical protein